MTGLTIELLESEIDYASQNSDFQGAFEAYQIATEWLKKQNMSKNSQEYESYSRCLIKLKFICLNYFDNPEDYVDLIKNYFNLSFQIPNFNLWDKLETELLYITDLDERDKVKGQFREALEKCDNIFTKEYNVPEMPRKTSEWIKNFISNLGLDKFDTVKKMEYLANGKFIKLLKEEDKNKVQVLLDIYEKLRLSSRTKDGYENSVMMNIDGKSVIYNRGTIEEIHKLGSLKGFSNNKPAPESPLTAAVPSPAPAAPIAPLSAVQPETSIQPLSKTQELEQSLKNYAPSSLEYKAIKQELKRLNKSVKKS